MTHILRLSEEGRAGFPNKSEDRLRQQGINTCLGFYGG